MRHEMMGIAMKKYVSALSACLVGSGIIALATVGPSNAEVKNVRSEGLLAAIERVRMSTSSDSRNSAAEHLFDISLTIDMSEVDEDVVSQVSSLLQYDEDPVQYWIARTLGNFGEKGKSSVPALLNLLIKVDCIKGSKTSASGIRFALRQLNVAAPIRNCR